MYTQLPKTEDEFEVMVNKIIAGYEAIPATYELVFRIQLDLNCLLEESGLKIIHKKASMRLLAYEVYRDLDYPDTFHVDPLWTPVGRGSQ